MKNKINKSIYIVDLVGSHCGMHYYDIAFSKVLQEKQCNVHICSNFTGFFPSIFRKNKFLALWKLFTCYIKYVFLILSHKKDKIIYLAYGEIYELPFLLSTIFSKNIYIDVHEVHALKYNDSSFVSIIFNKIYLFFIKNIIYHSERTKEILKNKNLRMYYVPHFKYVFKQTYNEQSIADDIKKIASNNTIKFLFFGNLSTIKGIDIILDSFNQLSLEELNVDLIIAGKNVENIDFTQYKSKKNYYIFDRHINDDELIYLYKIANFILLPYKQSSQSGIFAMAAYFRKPMILSDIPYFKNMLKEYPSFGVISTLNQYLTTIQKVIQSPIHQFYTTEDCNRFEEKEKIEKFLETFLSNE